MLRNAFLTCQSDDLLFLLRQLTKLTPLKLKPNIATSEAGFVFNPATGDSFAASPLAADILAQLRTGAPEAAIVASLLARYDVAESQLRRDLDDFQGQLHSFQLIEPAA